MDLYADNILDHYRSPRNKLPLPAGEGWGEGLVRHSELNPACGDELTIHLSIEDGRVTGIAWDGTGCAISQASMSMLSEELVGKTTKELGQLDTEHIYALLGITIGPRRFKCALLSLHTLKNALRTMKNLPLQGWPDTMAT